MLSLLLQKVEALAMPPSQPTGRALLQLYRRILRVHRERLPPPMRSLGDSYARDEFRRHRDEPTTPQQWATFEGEWRKYVAMLSGEADLVASGDIPNETLRQMTPDQRVRLQLLEEESRKALDHLSPDLSPGQDK